MEEYLQQLLNDIAGSTEQISLPFAEKQLQLHDWISNEEEERTALLRQLEEWTGINQEALPPSSLLSDEQVTRLLNALKKMLETHNWLVVFQIEVPHRIQYDCIRDNFNQTAKVKRWHMGFFELCREGTKQGCCALGEYCHCKLFAELFSGFIEEDISPEEERSRELQWEIERLKRKYDDDWMKYYPYHLDPAYDDKYGNPHDYGFGEEKDEDDWWKK